MNTTSELTQDQKRTLIAKACGIVWHPDDQHSIFRSKTAPMAGREFCGMSLTYDYCECGASKLRQGINWEFDSEQPDTDYFVSLDACHEMEEVLVGYDPQVGGSQYGRYITFLQGITGWWRTPCATAAQRAEAFGLTLGLW